MITVYCVDSRPIHRNEEPVMVPCERYETLEEAIRDTVTYWPEGPEAMAAYDDKGTLLATFSPLGKGSETNGYACVVVNSVAIQTETYIGLKYVRNVTTHKIEATQYYDTQYGKLHRLDHKRD